MKSDRIDSVKYLLNANLKLIPDDVLKVMSLAISAERTRRGEESSVIKQEMRDLAKAAEKYFSGRPYKRDKYNQRWLSYLSEIIMQDWSDLFCGDSEKKYYVYFHCDPRVMRGFEFHNNNCPFVLKGMPFYVGKGTGARAFDLNRNQGHGALLRQLTKNNYTAQDIVHVVKDGLSENEALELESKFIYFFGTKYEKGRSGILVNLDIPKRPSNIHCMKHSLIKYKQSQDSP